MCGLGLTQDQLGRHRFWQPAQGYRFSMDSVLLAGFVSPGVEGPVADLGAGCGVLCVLLAARGMAGPFIAVEQDPVLAECCRRNLSQAGLEHQVLEADLAQPPAQLIPGGQALVVTNPPFTGAGQGRMPPSASRARARHESSLPAAGWWNLAARLLPQGGRLALCWPPRRLVEVLEGLSQAGLTPKRLRLVHGRAHLPAKLALIEAVRQGGCQLTVEPPLVVHDQGETHGPQVRAIYQELGAAGS